MTPVTTAPLLLRLLLLLLLLLDPANKPTAAALSPKHLRLDPSVHGNPTALVFFPPASCCVSPSPSSTDSSRPLAPGSLIDFPT